MHLTPIRPQLFQVHAAHSNLARIWRDESQVRK
jgi:hypothetical protein